MLTRTITVTLLTLVMAHPAPAQMKGHSENHEFYKRMKIPGTGLSCCNDRDCRPAPHRVMPNGEIQFQSRTGSWFTPPPHKLLHEVTPDGGSHLCSLPTNVGSEYTFCAIVPLKAF